MRILVIEDEEKLADVLKEGLEAVHYTVATAHTGEEGFFLIETETFDLVILDVMLPGRNGIEILRAIRRSGCNIPVLMLTARDAMEDRVLGLDAGADDYLGKPFGFPELLARIRALGRRVPLEPASTLEIADLEMNVLDRLATRGGQMLNLTFIEFDLLEYLLRNQGNVVTRDMVARDVWRKKGRPTPLDSVIDVHLARLRRKVDEQFDKKLIHTVRGVGFVIRVTGGIEGGKEI